MAGTAVNSPIPVRATSITPSSGSSEVIITVASNSPSASGANVTVTSTFSPDAKAKPPSTSTEK